MCTSVSGGAVAPRDALGEGREKESGNVAANGEGEDATSAVQMFALTVNAVMLVRKTRVILYKNTVRRDSMSIERSLYPPDSSKTDSLQKAFVKTRPRRTSNRPHVELDVPAAQNGSVPGCESEVQDGTKSAARTAGGVEYVFHSVLSMGCGKTYIW